MYKAQVMNVLNLGEPMATGLGASVTRELKLLAGDWLGLVRRSKRRNWICRTYRTPPVQTLGRCEASGAPVTALVGALLVITADTLGRWIIQPSEIPTGIVVAVIGAPYFLYLLSRSRA